jgi:hypothetical protein
MHDHHGSCLFVTHVNRTRNPNNAFNDEDDRQKLKGLLSAHTDFSSLVFFLDSTKSEDGP